MDEFEFRQTLISSGLSAGQAAAKARMFADATSALGDAGSGKDLLYSFVPGRVEFLGKHTDYAGGRSLICAVERGFCIAAAPRLDDRVRITDAGRYDRIEFTVSAELIPRAGHWSNYPMTVASRIAQNFPGPLHGAEIAFINDLPPAAGLSSSSALVIAIFSALARVNELQKRDEYKREIDSLESLAGYLGTIENGQSFGFLAGGKGVGTFGGSQDHTAILCCNPGQLSQYSFCPVRHEGSIGLPGDYVLVVAVSGVSADKTGGALEKYNRVSLMAAEILSIWRKATGRLDATLMAAATSSADALELMRQVLSAARSSSFSSQDLINRYEQCVVECTEIIPGVAQALAAGDVHKIGALVDRSQESGALLLGNQVPETVALARLARELGAVAASAFGAGFGGSVWALVNAERAESFMSEWADEYCSKFPESASRAEFFVTNAGPARIEFAD
ncbi:MAG TPA: galactokinase family protein [Blastocatellia bacterium]|nr:galactokinase family protein [Blastocatellia bacterium]